MLVVSGWAENKEPEPYSQELVKRAEAGDAFAQWSLGRCYYKGIGVAQDYKEAVKWYTKSAEQGDAKAQSNLGVCYEKGTGVDKDEKQAVKWFTKSAEQGDATAQFFLGVCYANGKGVGKNEREAVKWYTKSADQGFALAQLQLSSCYYNGTGVDKDNKEAVKWLKQSAAQGLEQITQTIVVDLLHQLQQAPHLPFRETFTRKPIEVIAGQIGQQYAFVFAKRHRHGHQFQQVFRLHTLVRLGAAPLSQSRTMA